MIFSDDELKRWWAQLSQQDQRDLLATMVDKARDPEFALSLSRRYQQNRIFSPKQLAAIRKWWKP